MLIPGPLCVSFGWHPAVYTVNGPGIGGPGEHHWPADLFIFSKGLERASAQAFLDYIKGWARRTQADKQNFLIDSEPGTC